MTGTEIALLAAVAVSTAVTVASTVQTSQRQAKLAAYNARLQQREANQEALLQERSAQAADFQAAREREAAAFEARQTRTQAQILEARQRAIVGASGVQLVGSPLLAYLDNVGQHELEAQVQEYQGEVRSQAVDDQAALLHFQATELRRSGQLGLALGQSQARALRTAGGFQAGATAASGVVQGLSAHYTLNRPAGTTRRGATTLGGGVE